MRVAAIFAFARVLAMQLLGFGLAVAVLLDATVIRMVLVPAFMQAMGLVNDHIEGCHVRALASQTPRPKPAALSPSMEKT